MAVAPLRNLVDEIERGGKGLVMCMGKGGVGKTTVAAAIAVALANRGHDSSNDGPRPRSAKSTPSEANTPNTMP